MRIYDNICASAMSVELPDYIETRLKIAQNTAKQWRSVERFRWTSPDGIKLHFVVTESAMFIRGHGFRELLKISFW